MGPPKAFSEEEVAEIREEYSKPHPLRLVMAVLDYPRYRVGVDMLEVAIGERIVGPEDRLVSAIYGLHPVVDWANAITGYDIILRERLSAGERGLAAMGPLGDAFRALRKSGTAIQTLGRLVDNVSGKAIDFERLADGASDVLQRAIKDPDYLNTLSSWQRFEARLEMSASLLRRADDVNDYLQLAGATKEWIGGWIGEGESEGDEEGDSYDTEDDSPGLDSFDVERESVARGFDFEEDSASTHGRTAPGTGPLADVPSDEEGTEGQIGLGDAAAREVLLPDGGGSSHDDVVKESTGQETVLPDEDLSSEDKAKDREDDSLIPDPDPSGDHQDPEEREESLLPDGVDLSTEEGVARWQAGEGPSDGVGVSEDSDPDPVDGADPYE
jgi:hypothetical protein